MRKFLLLAVCASFAFATIPAHAQSILISEDPAGDWGNATTGTDAAAAGSALGQDLITATIVPDYEHGIMNFVIGVTELPPVGGTPEATRYTWSMTAGDQAVELDGKFTNYTRGTCDPTAGTCPPPRDPGAAPFAMRGSCVPTDLVATSFTFCTEFALVHATFDPTTATITIPAPIAALHAAAGASCVDIAPGVNIFGGFLSAAPSAWVTSSGFPMDFMEVLDEVVTVNTCP